VSAGGELLPEDAEFNGAAGLDAWEVGSPFYVRSEEMCERDAGGVANGGIAAGEGNVF
jgi:hypothetical protein